MNVKKILISFAVCYLVSIIGSIFTISSITTWYETLNKASFNPPNWVFGPVWTILYTLMALALYLVWNKKFNNVQKQHAIEIFSVQLALNLIWSLVFFGAHSPIFALIILFVLWVAILMTILLFRNISKFAAYILIPYILWVSLAFFLNLFVVLLN